MRRRSFLFVALIGVLAGSLAAGHGPGVGGPVPAGAELARLRASARDAVAALRAFETFAARRGYELLIDANIEDHRGRFGNVLLSRHPVSHVDRIDLSVGRFEPRGAIAARIELFGLPHLVVATHLGLRVRERRRQTARIARYVNACEPLPSILLGDLNEWQWRSRSIRAIAALYEKAPSPRSFPSWRPVFALDRILFRQIGEHPIVRTHAGPLSRTASDHLPVVARLHLAAAQGGPVALKRVSEPA